MVKVIKFIKNNIFGLILGMIITLTISVYAASTLSSSSVYYDNSESGGLSTNVSGAIDELYKKTEVVAFKLGDYIKMTPTKTSFSVPMTLTGYTSNQTINPSELNLWRVIKINSDGTVDIISEYISSAVIYFKGQIGYQNYIGTLNYIAKQYETNYTISSRYTGYNNHTEFITDTSKFSLTTPPWTKNTSDNSNEPQGGGDNLCLTDTSLITTALGKLDAYMVNTTDIKNYWISSREYKYIDTSNWYFYGRYINQSQIYSIDLYAYYRANYVSLARGNCIRPILTLKSGISNISGAGTSASPYVLN